MLVGQTVTGGHVTLCDINFTSVACTALAAAGGLYSPQAYLVLGDAE